MKTDGKIPIKAAIYTVTDGKTAVKAYANVAFGDSLYINSFSVALSSITGELTVYPPSVRCGGNRYKRILEFPGRGNNKLKEAITKVCLLAYAKYEDDKEPGVFGEPIYVNVGDLVDFEKVNAISQQKEGGDAELEDLTFLPF